MVMDFNLNDRKLPSPNNIVVSNPKGAGHLLVIWDKVRNPDQQLLASGVAYPSSIKEIKYNVYRSISLGGIFYKLNKEPLDQPRFEDKNIDRHPNVQYFYKVSTIITTFDNQTVEGNLSNPVIFHIPTTNKWFKKMNERNMWILKNTGVLMDLYVRKTEGERCSCWDSVRMQGEADCTLCYGTTFVGGYEPMMQLYVRQKPAFQQVDLMQNGYVLNTNPGAWTISPVNLRNRDLLINPEGKIFSITTSHVNHAAGYLFHQELTMHELDPTDRLYKIKRETLYPFM
jgi:hypothetical protein